MEIDKKLTIACENIRRKSRISRKQFADYLGLRVEDIRNFEKNVTTIPTRVLVEYQKLKERLNEIQG